MSIKQFNQILHHILVKKSNNFYLQFIRYFFVGGFAFVIDFSLLYILTTHLHIYYLISASISFLVGLIVNYIISIIWVFPNRQYKNIGIEFLLFAFIGILGLGINNLILWFLTDGFKLYYLFSKIVAAVFVYLWNFLVRKFFMYK